MSFQEFYKHANKYHFEEVLKSWFSCDACKVYFPSEDALNNHAFQVSRGAARFGPVCFWQKLLNSGDMGKFLAYLR